MYKAKMEHADKNATEKKKFEVVGVWTSASAARHVVGYQRRDCRDCRLRLSDTVGQLGLNG